MTDDPYDAEAEARAWLAVSGPAEPLEAVLRRAYDAGYRAALERAIAAAERIESLSRRR